MGEDERFQRWVGAWPHDVAAAGTTAERLLDDHARLGPESLVAGRKMLGEWLAALD